MTNLGKVCFSGPAEALKPVPKVPHKAKMTGIAWRCRAVGRAQRILFIWLCVSDAGCLRATNRGRRAFYPPLTGIWLWGTRRWVPGALGPAPKRYGTVFFFEKAARALQISGPRADGHAGRWNGLAGGANAGQNRLALHQNRNLYGISDYNKTRGLR